MRPWFLMLGGMVVWAIHFSGVYVIASVFDLVSSSTSAGSRIATAILTLVCLAIDAILLAVTIRRHQGNPDAVVAWMMVVGSLLAATSFLSVAWQGLPALFG